MEQNLIHLTQLWAVKRFGNERNIERHTQRERESQRNTDGETKHVLNGNFPSACYLSINAKPGNIVAAKSKRSEKVSFTRRQKRQMENQIDICV